AHQQFGRIPPRYQLMPMRPKHPPQRLGVARKLVAQFHPRKPGLPRLGQAHLQRRLPANLDHIVIGPPDWVRTDPDHVSSFILIIRAPSVQARPVESLTCALSSNRLPRATLLPLREKVPRRGG